MTGMIERVRGYKPAEVAAAKRAVPPAEMYRRAEQVDVPPRGFAAAVERTIATGRPALIAEIKKASPSRGLIRADFAPAQLAGAYAHGGATCLSVLTDAPSFQGAPEHLQEARSATDLPTLPKDFLIDPYQVAQARTWLADAVLIILALVDDALAQELEEQALAYGLDVVVEIHDEEELERAMALRTPLIGINNRNLQTFETTLATCEKLAPRVPADRRVIGESGLHTTDDLNRLAAVGIHAYWVGESLMRRDDVGAATRDLLAGVTVRGGEQRHRLRRRTLRYGASDPAPTGLLGRGDQ